MRFKKMVNLVHNYAVIGGGYGYNAYNSACFESKQTWMLYAVFLICIINEL